jgi:hypothetical protein
VDHLAVILLTLHRPVGLSTRAAREDTPFS